MPHMIRTLALIWTGFVGVSLCLITRRKDTEVALNALGSEAIGVTCESRELDTVQESSSRESSNCSGSIPNPHQRNHSFNTVNMSTEEEKSSQSPSASYNSNGHQKYEIKSVRYCIYSVRFWQLISLMLFANYFGTFFMYAYKTYGENGSTHEPISDKTLTWASSIGAGLVNGVSRLVLGSLVDRYGFKKLFAILMTS